MLLRMLGPTDAAPFLRALAALDRGLVGDVAAFWAWAAADAANLNVRSTQPFGVELGEVSSAPQRRDLDRPRAWRPRARRLAGEWANGQTAHAWPRVEDGAGGRFRRCGQVFA